MNGKISSADNVLRRKTDEVAEADNGVAEAELTTTKEPEKAGKGGRKEHGDAKGAKQEPEEKPLPLEAVRAVLAE